MTKGNGRFGEVWDGLPPWAKGVTIVATLGIAAFIGYEVWSHFKAKAAVKAAGGGTVDDAGNDLGKLAASGIYPSYLGTQYATWADTIQTVLDGCGQDGFEDTVKGIFAQMKNTSDVLQLIQAFGVRVQNPCWLRHPLNDIESIFKPTAFQGGLMWWLGQSLTSDDFAAINADFQNRNINFTVQ